MNNISLSQLTKTVIGIERLIENVQNSVVTTASAFPLYNITKHKDDETSYTVTLGIAGYSKDDIEITQEGSNLIISGRAAKDEDVIYLYKGLTQKDFTRVLTLHEYSVVTGSVMKDGLLHINVKIELPEHKKPRKINID